MPAAQALRLRRHRFPYFLKPWDGHASKGNAVVRNREELRFYAGRIPNCIVQEFVPGQEYTVDVLVDFAGQVRCVVPRLRIETRTGEVSKGMTVKHPEIIAQSQRLVEELGAGPGVITIQCFLTPDQQIKFIEINPRFGGGVPLSIKAGADFPRWLLQLWLGQAPRIPLTGWRDGLVMLRYDEAIWRQPG
jgi:carbamoyl-phosphate synthase large subunit